MNAPVDKGALRSILPASLHRVRRGEDAPALLALVPAVTATMKRVLAAKDDTVTVADDGVRSTASYCHTALRSRPTRAVGLITLAVHRHLGASSYC
jgi:hypothetical protein